MQIEFFLLLVPNKGIEVKIVMRPLLAGIQKDARDFFVLPRLP